MAANIKYKICVIGAGGTGGYFLKEFSRYISGRTLPISQLIVVDGDIVEEHNLTRQCFIREDIGLKKASVLTEILNDTFSLDWECYPAYLESKEQLLGYLGDIDSSTIPVIIGCVDNHGCRLILEDVLKSLDNCIYFDSANEIESGEVIFTYKLKGIKLCPLRSEIFPDLLNGDIRNVTDLSCEELNTILPQHIATNMLAGNILLSSICSLLDKGTLKKGMTCFNCMDMMVEFIPLQPKEDNV